MELNKYGEIAKQCWNEIPDHFPNVQLDEFVIMPNHIHGIIVIMENEKQKIVIDDIVTNDTAMESDTVIVGAIHELPLRYPSDNDDNDDKNKIKQWRKNVNSKNCWTI